MELLLTTHQTKQLDKSSYRKCHAVGILTVGDIKGCSTALHLACQEREVHIVSGHEEGLVPGDEVANEW